MNKIHSAVVALLIIVSCGKSADVVWTFSTAAPIYAMPAIAGDHLIIGSNDHHLYKLTATSGEVAWKKNLGERVIGSPLVHGGTVYVGTAGGDFLSLRLQDGAELWRFKSNDRIDFLPCADESAVYFGGKDEYFYKIDKSTGAKVWSYKAGFRFSSSCTVHKDLVMTTSWDGNLYAFDRNSGEIVWKVNTGQYHYGGPSVYGDSVYFATHNMLFRVDTATGKVLGRETVKYLDHAIVHQDFLWTNDVGLTKRGLDLKRIAETSFQANPDVRPVAWKDYIILSVQPNALYAVSTNDLKVRWKFESGDSFLTPGVIHNGVYYAGNRDGKVYALRLPE